jgi:hypothetical protein
MFVGVLDALALVGFGRSLLADFSGKLADLLLVDTLDDECGLGSGTSIWMSSVSGTMTG